MSKFNLHRIGQHIEKHEGITRDELLASFTGTFNAGQVDREIERLSKAVEDEKAATKEVVADLGVKLRHNRMLNSAIRANTVAPELPPIPLPFKHD